MLCPACQAESLTEDGVCRSCGLNFSAVCPNCRHPNLEAARFCGACGERLDQAQTVGERKVVTVMFADIVGSTELIGDNDPELALDRLPPALARMGHAVQQFHGTIMRSMGDGLMVIFGIPHAQEDHALRACQAALAMMQSSRDNGIVLRVGIHSGEIVAGVPDKFTKEQSVYGAAVHLASRLEHMAQPGDICVTESTFKLVQASCDARALGHQNVKGFPRPIGVYRLVGMKPSRAPFRDAVVGTYRGRDAELAILQEAFAGAEQGAGKVIGISAPPGLGKSRLCFEIARSVKERLVPVQEASASPYDHSGPLQPLLEFFRNFFRIASIDDAETARAKVAARIESSVPHLMEDVALLADFLGIRDTQSPAPALDPKTRHTRLVNLVASLVRDGTRTPSVIIIEDIHWLDEASIEFVSALVNVAQVSRALIILTYRPTYAPWQEGPGFHEIRLDELRDEDVSALISDMIGDHPSTAAISDRIVERSGGNPFFAEELVRSLIDSGDLTGRPGEYEMSGQASPETLPATVQTVIGARIDRLAPMDKEVLQVGATIGREFPFSVLAEVARASYHDLVGILGRLSHLELIQEVASEIEHDRYAFRHPLIQEVAYAMQLRTRRVELHQAVASALERFYHNRLGEYANLIAYHFESAKDFGSAANYLARSASWIGTTNSRLGMKSWLKVRLLLQSLPRSPETDRLRMHASGQVLILGWREGISAEEAAPFFREALAAARDLKDSLWEVLLLAAFGRVSAGTGSADEYVRQLLEAIEVSEDPSIRTMMQVFLCQAYGYAGKLREALAAGETALKHIASIEKAHEAPLGFNVERWVEGLHARLLARTGNFDVARERIAKLVASESGHPDPAVLFIPHHAGVEMAWLTRDEKLADLHSLRIEEIARRNDTPYVAVYASVCRGLALSLAGEHVAAIQKIESAIRLAREAFAGLEYESDMLAFLAEIHLRSNSLAAAFGAAEQGIAVARERRARLAECRSTLVLAHVVNADSLRYPQYRLNELLARARLLIEETGASPYERLFPVVQSSSCGQEA
ncbi:adenylate/guanylate cyclase domain-containing protein [Bradyrhizobium sp. 2S1]|uniref:adenylate/guanylate cyclase domain-containing protein n=1 Tax=Bradyrhizobium sp. 2S1 TaxID=1404429 RepID=UPI001408EF48|nr:adenylate/guanylate cyclase domain-containing protein [Bradyrhizobium sp. 2S1]MCK7672101.1 AAA family ATPase [Bradyrhizobium sp. 2S1]